MAFGLICMCAVILGLALTGCGDSDDGAADAPRSTNPGSSLVFASNRDTPQLLNGDELYLIDSDGGTPKRLTNNKTFDGTPACSPDGRTIAFTSARSQGASLYLMKLDGSERRRLMTLRTNDLSPSWSPDGKEIAFVREGLNGDLDLFIVGVDGGDARRLISSRGSSEVWPAWSPQGDRIAFLRASDPQDETLDLYVTSVAGTETKRLLRNVDTGRVTWSPDGDELAFVPLAGDPPEGLAISIIDVATLRVRPLTLSAAPASTQSDPAWSPDGSMIAFAEFEGLAVVHPDGSDYRQLIGDESPEAQYTDLTWCGSPPR